MKKKDENIQYDKNNGCVYSSFVYSLGKDIDGNKHNIDELHQVLLEMMDVIDSIFRKHNIPYALAFGSTIGIYNYKGFIPWDDDIDVAINYEDIPKIIEAFKKDLPKEYTFDCYENDQNYNVLIPTFKVRKVNSYIKETNNTWLPNRCKNGDGIFIDMVAFMGVPENKNEYKKILKKTKKKIGTYIFFNSLLRFKTYRLKRKIKEFEKECYEKYKNTSLVSQTVIIPWQDWDNDVTSLAYPKEMIYPFKEYEFEGRKYYSFNDIKAFIKHRHGEIALKKWDGNKWIDNYPLNKRNPKHFKEYSLTRKK